MHMERIEAAGPRRGGSVEMPVMRKGTPMTDLIWSFSPWMSFLLATRFTNLYGGLIAGGLVGLVVFMRSATRKNLHMLDVASVFYFLVLSAAVVVIHPSDIDTWGRYAQAGSHGLLTVLVFGSVLIGRPFTESYARARAPQAVWATPQFHGFNRQISLAWGAAFLLGTASMALAGAVDQVQVVLRVLVPFGALLLAFRYTQQQASLTMRPHPARNS
jgi:hypothetical protein